jgi:hypothetical protein
MGIVSMHAMISPVEHDWQQAFRIAQEYAMKIFTGANRRLP